MASRACSVASRRNAAATLTPARGAQHARFSYATARLPVRPTRRALPVSAVFQEGDRAKPGVEPAFVSSLKQSCDRFFNRHDFLSTGLGALSVTTYCVIRGQDTATAASITIMATIVALVVNEVLFSSDCQQ